MEFRTVRLLACKTATGIEVPPGVVEALGSGRKPAVTVTLNGHHSYPSTVRAWAGSTWCRSVRSTARPPGYRPGTRC